jgi:hypothetical protein
MSFLSVVNIIERFDPQKEGYYSNYELALTFAPTDTVLTLDFEIKNGGIISTFEARKVHIDNDIPIVDKTIALINTKIISGIVTNISGYKATTSTNHNYLPGDVITQSGFVGADSGYNGIKTILSCPTLNEYIIAGIYTSSKTGAVNKNAITVNKIGDNYFVPAREALPSLLDKGLYYYYISDGINEMRSELFCIKEGLVSFSRYFANNLGHVFADNNDKILTTI